MDAPSIELELRRALAQGDRRRAASLLVEHYAADVLACCRAMLRDRTLAEDLAQDTFGRAIAGLAEFRGESSPRTWLLSIARNGCLDVMRRRRASPIDEAEAEPDEHAAPAPAAIDQLLRREDVERALAPLGETERALVVLHYGHGVGYVELAQAFALREGAVRMRMSRAVDKMREALAEPETYETFAAARPALGAPAAAAVPPRIPEAPAAPSRARAVWPFGGSKPPVPAAPPVPVVPRAPVPASPRAAAAITAPASLLRELVSPALHARLTALVATA